MNAPGKPKTKAVFVWDDPLLLNDQLTDDERMVRDAAHAYCQGKLAPRVLEAFRHERTDPAIFREMGELGFLGATLRGYGCAGVGYVSYGLIMRELERVDTAEAGTFDEAVELLERGGEVDLERCAGGIGLVVDDPGRNAGLRRVVEPQRAGPVADHLGDRAGDLSGGDRVDQRHQVGAASGDENGDARRRHRTGRRVAQAGLCQGRSGAGNVRMGGLHGQRRQRRDSRQRLHRDGCSKS